MHKTEPCIVLFLIILTILSVANVPFAKSQSTLNLININADGTIDPSTVPIQRNGNFYTLTGNISGGIAVHKSNILIDGAGYTLQGNGGTGIDLQNNVSQVPSLREIWNVTIKNLRIINFNFSVQTNGGGNNTFYNDYIANTISGMRGGIFLWGCGGNNITRCTISGEPAIFMDFVSSRNTITENNLSGGVWVELSGNETVDRNYWSDYLTKYPNATEVDSSGIGNTPYVFDSFGLVSGILQDNHPLMNPVSITVPEFPSWIILPLLIIVAIGIGLFVYFKKRNR
jgi:parallel beta-helix repeat protein